MYDPLIFGKSNLERIVNIEVIDDTVEVYRELEDGTVDTVFLPNKFWVLASSQLQRDWVRLKGDLFYRWGKQFTERDAFVKCRSRFRNDGIFSIYNAKEAIMVKDGLTQYKGMSIQDVSILSFDIETTSLSYKAGDKVLLISNTFRKQGKITKKLFAYDEYDSQGEMLDAWCEWVREVNPSILCGHNINGFDILYLESSARDNGTSLTLGRDGSPITFNSYTSKFRKDGSQEYEYRKVNCFGREIVDTFFLAIKYDQATRKYTSYGLKSIIKEEGLERQGREFYDANDIRKNYLIPEEFKKIKAYCIDDSDDALALFDLMAPSFFYFCQSIPKPFQLLTESATGSQLNALLIRSYLQEGHSLPKADEAIQFEGGISQGTPGIWKNVVKVDISSLYPSIILQWEVFNKDKDPQGNFLKMVDVFTKQRLEHKKLAKDTGKQYYKDLEQSEKIGINSSYGMLSTSGLLFNSPKHGSFITEQGRKILIRAIQWSKDNNLILTNCDTDSISFCKQDQSFITEDERKQYLDNLNSLYPEKIRFCDDGYFDRFIVLKAKTYIMKNDKGVKIKGSALKSSTKEPALKELISEIVQTILEDKYDYVNIYHKYIKRAMSITTKEEMKKWSSRKTWTERTINSERTNESKIRDAVGDIQMQEGDKLYCHYRLDDTLALIQDFNGDYNKIRLIEKVWKTIGVFSNILDINLFIKFHLKKNQEKLNELK